MNAILIKYIIYIYIYRYRYRYIYIYPNSNTNPLNAIPSNDKQQFRLNKINEIRDYVAVEIKERELMSKRLRKYIAFLTILINH